MSKTVSVLRVNECAGLELGPGAWGGGGWEVGTDNRLAKHKNIISRRVGCFEENGNRIKG